MRRYLSLAVVCLLCFAFAGEAKFPSFNLKSFDGKEVSLDSILVDQKPVLLTFWATWCKQCTKELHALLKDYDSHQDPPYQVVVLCEDGPKSVSQAKSMVVQEGWKGKFLFLYDDGAKIKTLAGVSQIPEMFIIRTDGSVFWRKPGYKPGDEKKVFDKLKELTSEEKQN